MVARDERAHLAAGHFEVFAGGIEVGADDANFGVNILQVVGSGLASKFGVDGSVQRGDLGGGVFVSLNCFFPSLLKLALGNLELAGDHLQVALEVRIRLFGLSKAVLQRRHILLNRGLCGLQLRCNILLRRIELGRCVPSKCQTSDSNQAQHNNGGKLPGRRTLHFCIIVGHD